MKKTVCVLAFFTLLFCIGLSGCDGSTSGDKEGDGIFGRPDAPTDVDATATSSRSIEVSWRSVSGAFSYYVYRSSSSSGPWTDKVEVYSSESYTESYTHTSLTSGTTYSYKVSAVNNAGEGNQSSVKSATTKLAAPTGVSAIYDEDSESIVVSWSRVSGASSYKVHRSTSPSGTYTPITTTPSTSYTESDVSPGTYYYKVSAINSTGEGDQSAPTSETVPDPTS